MKHKCYCGKETDEFRFCRICEIYDHKRKNLCWSHVIRLELCVHKDDVNYTLPFYVCRNCLKRDIKFNEILYNLNSDNINLKEIINILQSDK